MTIARNGSKTPTAAGISTWFSAPPAVSNQLTPLSVSEVCGKCSYAIENTGPVLAACPKNRREAGKTWNVQLFRVLHEPRFKGD